MRPMDKDKCARLEKWGAAIETADPTTVNPETGGAWRWGVDLTGDDYA